MDHISAQSPIPKRQARSGGRERETPKAQARTHDIVVEEARHNDEVIFGTYLVNSISTSVLYNRGTNRSIVYISVCAQFKLRGNSL